MADDAILYMELTAAQQKYFAYWLTRSLPSDSLGKPVTSVQNTQVGLILHPINLFHITLDKRTENLESWADNFRFDFGNHLNLYNVLKDLDEKISSRLELCSTIRLSKSS